METVTGEIIAFLDPDDQFPVDKFAHQTAILTSDSEIDIVLGALQYCEYQPSGANNHCLKFLSEPLLAFNLGVAIMRKSTFDQVGSFDEQPRYSDDWGWFCEQLILDYTMLKHHRSHSITAVIQATYLFKGI